MSEDETDWKLVATELARRLVFAVKFCETRGSGQMLENGQIKPWLDWFIEGVEMIPGTKIDREMLDAMRIGNAKERARAIKGLKRAREATR